MAWPSKNPADYQEIPRERGENTGITPPPAEPGARQPHPEFSFEFEREPLAQEAAYTLRGLGYAAEVERNGLFSRARWALVAHGMPAGSDLVAADLTFGQWARESGGRYVAHEVPRTRIQVFCAGVAVLLFEIGGEILDLPLGDFGTRALAVVIGGGVGRFVADRIERKLEEAETIEPPRF